MKKHVDVRRMEQLPHSHLEKGTFLISTPEIDTGLFYRSVILLCEHTPQGSFGLVVNKSLDLELPEDIIDMNELANPHVGVRAAGPVQTNQMMLLHTASTIPNQTLPICEGVYLGGDLNFLQDNIVNADGPFIYLCFGYAGWGGGQLERIHGWQLALIPSKSRSPFYHSTRTTVANTSSTLRRQVLHSFDDS